MEFEKLLYFKRSFESIRYENAINLPSKIIITKT